MDKISDEDGGELTLTKGRLIARVSGRSLLGIRQGICDVFAGATQDGRGTKSG